MWRFEATLTCLIEHGAEPDPGLSFWAKSEWAERKRGEKCRENREAGIRLLGQCIPDLKRYQHPLRLSSSLREQAKL